MAGQARRNFPVDGDDRRMFEAVSNLGCSNSMASTLNLTLLYFRMLRVLCLVQTIL